MKWKRRLLVALVLFLVLAGSALFAAHLYLRSSAATRKAEALLEETLGVPVRVDSVAVNLVGSSHASNIEVYEPGAETPWLSLGELSADASALSLLRRDLAGKTVTVRDARIHLRFSADGRLLTELPQSEGGGGGESALPAIAIEQGELTIDQEGRTPLVLHGIGAHLHSEGGSWRLEGEIKDPRWGEWDATGSLDPSGGTTLVLKGERVVLSPPRLRDLPFVLPAVWDQVQAEGPAKVQLRLATGGSRGFSYHVEIDPREARVWVTSAGIDATKTTGRVIVDDGLVTLRDLRGRSSGGDITAAGDLDFRPTPWKLAIRASARRVDLQDFTHTWGLPPQIRAMEGKLTGKADLVLRIDRKLSISGEGKGEIEEAVLPAKKPGEEPIPLGTVPLRLYCSDGKPRFSSDRQTRAPAPLPGLGPLLLSVPLLDAPPAEQPQREELNSLIVEFPSLAASYLHRGVRYAGNAVADTGKAILAALPGGKPKPPGMGTTYFEANFSLTDVDIGQLVRRVGVDLPFPVGGRGSLKVQVALPVDTPGDLKAYRLDGTVSLARITIADLELTKVEGKVRLNSGVLTVDKLHGEVPSGTRAGTFQGNARMQVSPLGDITAGVTLADIPVDRVATLVPDLAGKTAGTFGGTLSWRSPARKIREVAAWEAKADVQADRVRVREFALDQATAVVELSKGVVKVTRLKAGVEGLNVTGSGSAMMEGDYPFQMRLDLENADLAQAEKLLPGLKVPLAVEGKLTAGTTLKGTLTPLKVNAAGNIDARLLKLNDVRLEAVKTGWKFEEDRLLLEGLSAILYKGKVSGSATLPVRKTDEGQIDLKLESLDVGLLAKDVKRLPVRLEGEASGRLTGKLAPETAAGERDLSTRLDLEAPKLRVQGVPTEKLHGRVSYRRGVVRYKLEGDALGGQFELEGRVPLTSTPPAAGQEGALPAHQRGQQAVLAALEEQADDAPGPSGKFRLRRARIGAFIQSLTGRELRGPVHGLLDVELDYTTNERGELTGDGQVVIARLSWNRVELANRLAGNLRLRGGAVELIDFGGEALDGLLRARAVYYPRQPDRGTLVANLDRIDGSRVAAAFLDDESLLDGPIDVRFWTRLGREWRGGGEAVMTHGKVAGVDIAEWRIPYQLAFTADGSGQLDVHDSTAQFALGRGSGRASFGWGASNRAEGTFRFTAVEMRSLLRPFADVERQLGAGRATGRFDFSGRDMLNLNDLNGRLDMDFAQAQALQMPILSGITPFLRGVSSATSFEKGDLRATLARGLWRVQRLTAEGRAMRLLAEGTISSQGRLDLEVTARTGELVVNPALLGLLGLAVGQPVPLEALARASAWLSNRVVHLRVDGTLRNPTVRIEPVVLLTEEVVRFFLYRSTLPASPRPISP